MIRFRNKERPEENRKKTVHIPAVIKTRLRRAGALVLALVMFCGAAFGSLPDGFLSDLFSSMTAKAEELYTIAMRNDMYDAATIESFNREDESLWFFDITKQGDSSWGPQTGFCMNSGAALHRTDDYYLYSTTSASSYSYQDAAKALTWYNTCVENGGYLLEYETNGVVVFTYQFDANECRALTQAYVWADDGLENLTTARSTAVREVLIDYCGMPSSTYLEGQRLSMAVSIICGEINNTTPSGYIYVYKCRTCHKGYSASSHQVIIGWDDETPPTIPDEPEIYYDEISLSYTASSSENVDIIVEKLDNSSKNRIDSASFTIKLDGTTITKSMIDDSSNGLTLVNGSVTGSTFTTKNGYIELTYSGGSTTITRWTSTYTYVTKVVNCSVEDREDGTYADKDAAIAAAQEEIRTKIKPAVDAEVNSSTTHTWSATETAAPKAHSSASTATKSVTTTGSTTTPKTLTFTNTPLYIGVKVEKSVASGYEDLAEGLSLAGAEYTIYAGEKVLNPSDNSSTLYTKDQAITTITTNSKGEASLSYTKNLLPAGYTYYVKETKAAPGFTLDENTYEFTADGETEKSATVSSSEVPKFGWVEIVKEYEDYTDGSRAIYPEVNATFDVYKVSNGKETYVETLTTDSSGYAISGMLVYGTYVLCQTSSGDGADNTAFMADQTFTISQAEQLISYPYTNPDNSAKIRVSKTMTTKDYTTNLYISEAENDAVFYIVDASKLSGLTMAGLNAMTADERKAAVESAVSSSDIISVTTGYIYEPVSETYTTGTAGEAETAVDPGATYWVIQVTGANGYSLADVQSVTVPANDNTYHDVSFDNVRYGTRVELTKLLADYDGTSQYGYEAGSEEPEEDAVFYIIDASKLGDKTVDDLTDMTAKERKNWADNTDGAVIAEFTTDENGYGTVYFANDTYTDDWIILQVTTQKGYSLMDAITGTQWAANNTPYGYATFSAYTDPDVEETTVYTVDSGIVDPFDDWGYLSVEKDYQVANGLAGTDAYEAEAGAEFVAYDDEGIAVAVAVTDSDGKGDFIAIETDDDGNPVTDSNGEYILTGEKAMLALGYAYTIKQTKGADGHTLAADGEIILDKSTKHETYKYSASNPSEDLTLTLKKISSDTGAPVSGATYEIYAENDVYDADGSVLFEAGTLVCTIGTDDDGQGSWDVRYGDYYMQETGSPYTLVKDTNIYYFTIDINGITFTKSVSASDEDDPDYEQTAPAGHELGVAQAFTWDYTYDDEGNVLTKTGHVTIITEDEPVFGEIEVEKQGPLLTGLGSKGFTWANGVIEGAVFAIYAAEDIANDAGEVVQYYATDINGNAGNKLLSMTEDEELEYPIAYAVSDENGIAHFYWTKYSSYTDVTEYTDQWYLGYYYIKEISVPDGYTLDENTYKICLTWDLRSDAMTDTSGSLRDSTSATSRGIIASTGQYVLETGKALNTLLTSDDLSSVTSVVFSPYNAAYSSAGASGVSSGGYTWWDVSQDQDGSVMLYVSGTTAYIVPYVSSKSAGTAANQVVYLNADSMYMFNGCRNLESINFDNADTSLVIATDYMFCNCTGLTELDLTNWNTTSLLYVTYMFYGCTNLETVYAYGLALTEWTGSLDDAESITAFPATSFSAEYHDIYGNEIAADTFTAEDFNFYIYDVYGGQYSVTLTDDDIASITFSPETSSSAYATDDTWLNEEHSLFYMYVTITFDSSSEYAAYCDVIDADGNGSITIPVKVWCIDNIIVPDAITEHPEYTLSIINDAQKVSIEIDKVDENDDPVSGAVIGLYANCDIMDADGNVIVKAGELISKAVSPESTSKYETGGVYFSNLPSKLYAVDGTYLSVQSDCKYIPREDGETDGDGSGEYMYYVKEIQTPLGYDGDGTYFYAQGSVIDGESVTSYYSEDVKMINTQLEYPTIVKQWDDDTDGDGTGDDEGTRPDYVLYTVYDTNGTAKYILAVYGSGTVYVNAGDHTSKAYTGGYTLLYNYDYALSMYYSSVYKSRTPVCMWLNLTSTDQYGLDTPNTYWGVILDDNNYSVTIGSDGSPVATGYTLASSKYGFTGFSHDPDSSTRPYYFSEITGGSATYAAETLSSGASPYTLRGRLYTKDADSWLNSKKLVWATVNRYSTEVSASVTKTWDDCSDADGYRPDSLTFTLYQDGSIYYDDLGSTVTATITGTGNTWTTYTVDGLETGHTYTWIEEDFTYSEEYETTYTVREDVEDETGEEKTDPESWYDETIRTWVTEVTNKHDALVNISITKEWDDDLNGDGTDDDDGIRPSEIYVKLMADGIWVDVTGTEVTDDTTEDTAIKLTADNNWTAAIEGLQKTSAAGSAINYTFEEARNGDTLIVDGTEITLSGTWMVSDTDYPAETGYASESTVSYNEDTLTWEVSMTNTHDRTPITIKAYKKVALDDISFYFGDPEFTFTLTGTTIYGEAYTETHTVTITEVTDDSYTWLLDNETETTVQRTGEEGEYAIMEVTFGDGENTLVYGNYSLSESMDDKLWYMESLEINGGHSDADDSSIAVFELPTYEAVEAASEDTGEISATFTNASYKGTVHIVKEDGSGNTLENVTFTLVRTDGKITSSAGTDGLGTTYEVTTNSAGAADFTDLLAGEYTLTEVKTADGYSLLADNISIIIPMSMTEEEADSLGVDTTAAVESGDNLYFYTLSYRVTDTAEFEMPLTGSSNVRTRMLYVAGILSLILAVLAARQKKGTHRPGGGGNTPAAAGASVRNSSRNDRRADFQEMKSGHKDLQEGGSTSC